MLISLIHQLYRHLRPILSDWGVLDLARACFAPQIRQALAQFLGLSGFDISRATGTTTPTWLANVRPHPRLNGVNILADWRADLGNAEASRALLGALAAVNLPSGYYELPLRFPSRTYAAPLPPTTSQPYDFSVMDVPIVQFYDVLRAAPRVALESAYRIAYWAWELENPPFISPPCWAWVDEIWTPSAFAQASLAQIAPCPVQKMPHVIQVQASCPRPRELFGLPEDIFIVGFGFNALSGAARKNPWGVIEAFRRAFGEHNREVLLVIKAHHLQYAPQVAAALTAALKSVGGRLIRENLTRQATTDLWAACDCYCSLHRAEGFGLVLAEAMALGKPVIATRYSGNLEFMTPENSLGVDYTLRSITAADHALQPSFQSIYPLGERWAEPDLDHAASHLRWVFEHPHAATVMGQLAATDLARRFSPVAIGQQIRHRLQEIAA